LCAFQAKKRPCLAYHFVCRNRQSWPPIKDQSVVSLRGICCWYDYANTLILPSTNWWKSANLFLYHRQELTHWNYIFVFNHRSSTIPKVCCTEPDKTTLQTQYHKQEALPKT